jgi:hypothetical protein
MKNEIKEQAIPLGFALTGGYLLGRVAAGEYIDQSRIEPLSEHAMCASKLGDIELGDLPENCDANWINSEYSNQPATIRTEWQTDENGLLKRVVTEETNYTNIATIAQQTEDELTFQLSERENYAHEVGIFTSLALGFAVIAKGIIKYRQR